MSTIATQVDVRPHKTKTKTSGFSIKNCTQFFFSNNNFRIMITLYNIYFSNITDCFFLNVLYSFKFTLHMLQVLDDWNLFWVFLLFVFSFQCVVDSLKNKLRKVNILHFCMFLNMF